MSTLLLFPSVFYSGDPCKNRWNKTVGSEARNFSKGDLLYANFLELKQLCSFLQSCRIHDFDSFIFFKTAAKNCNFFHFFKEPLFPTGWSQENESWRILKDLSRLSKNLVSQLFSQYCQIYINLTLVRLSFLRVVFSGRRSNWAPS